tara:strand:- start:656 stop:856 length:201 start_codon:yes stop_codon:yes gene_type:complete
MKCYFCDKKLIHGGDHDLEEDYEDYDMVSNFTCPGCESFYLIYIPSKKNETDDNNSAQCPDLGCGG